VTEISELGNLMGEDPMRNPIVQGLPNDLSKGPIIGATISANYRSLGVQSVSDYEKAEEERDFMRAVVAGLADLEAGREVGLEEAKKRLGLK
jgi:hypothetical protein